jgi:hypothetical protein
VAKIVAESETVVDAAVVVPNDAVQPLAKFVPVSVTTVPPAGGPLVGFTPVNVGVANAKVNAAGSVALPPGQATPTSTTPAA